MNTRLDGARPPGWLRVIVRAMAWIGGHELVTLVVLAGVVTATWGFVEIAEEVFEGETREIDRRLLLALRVSNDPSDPIGPRWVEEMGRDVTALGGTAVLVLLTAAVAALLLLSGRGRAALVVVVAVAGGLGVSMLLKAGFQRPRPELVPHGSVVYTTSFPSGHSTLAAATYLTLAALLARVYARRTVKAYLFAAAAFVTFLVGASRVYLGVHWPTDVLAGWSIGAAWALVCWLLMRRLQREGRVEDEGAADVEAAEPGTTSAGAR